MVECDVKNSVPDLNDYSKNQIDLAMSAFNKWTDWKTRHSFSLIASELQLASDKYQYGGTADLLANVDGKITLIDLKTSRSVYMEQKTQVVAYKWLLEENGHKVEECRIIRIGRSDAEGFEDVLIGGHDMHWKVFKSCLDLYWASKNLENSGS
jgi:hypothetical protein